VNSPDLFLLGLGSVVPLLRGDFLQPLIEAAFGFVSPGLADVRDVFKLEAAGDR
jgi:hypothetical protein